MATLVALNQARPNTARESRIAEGTSELRQAALGRPIVLAARNHLPPLRRDPFAPRVEAPPPSSPPVAQVQGPPPGPQAPPVPYRFAGKVTYGGKSRVALTTGDRIHLVIEGDAVDGGYVVRKVSTDKVTLVYTPLGIDHELALVVEPSVPAPAPVAAPVQMAAEITAPSAGQAPAAAPAPTPARPSR